MTDKTKIALVYSSMNNHLGGKNVHLKNLYHYLGKDGFRVCIIGCSNIEGEWRDFMLQEGVKEEDLIMLPQFKKWLLLPFILHLRRIFITQKINIVHTFQIQSDILGGLAARLAGITHIISQYESKVIEDNISAIKQCFYKISNALIKGWFKKTVVVSTGLKKELIAQRFRPQDKIEIIHLGVKLPESCSKTKFTFDNLKEGRPLIGAIGRLSKEKALDRLIMSIPLVLQEVPKARFIIFGRGEERESLLNLISRLDISSKIILNDFWVYPLYEALQTFDIFVMPSIREGCPTALLEALALARPVIASDIEGIKDIIEDGRDGLMVDTANPELFAQKIIFLCKNPEKAIWFGENGRKKVLNEFTIDAEIERFKKLYLGFAGGLLD